MSRGLQGYVISSSSKLIRSSSFYVSRSMFPRSLSSSLSSSLVVASKPSLSSLHGIRYSNNRYNHIATLASQRLFSSIANSNSNANSNANGNPEKFIDYFSCTTSSIDNKPCQLPFGDYNLIASQEIDTIHNYLPISALSSSHPQLQQRLWIRGRINNKRIKGNACFLVIRSGLSTIQACYFLDKTNLEQSKAMMKYIDQLTPESIVDIYGLLSLAKVKSCTQHDVEVQINNIYTVSRAPIVLPFQLDDAARSNKDIELSIGSERPFSSVSQEVRLNNRWLDLRVPANNAIMRIKSGVCLLFREYLHSEGFTEIQTPKLIGGESEGGSNVFRTDYFGQVACLAQSPQLYKQMAISSDLDRVFEIGPVFRAEKSQTKRHLCEFTGLDIEMEIKSHYNEVLVVIHKLFKHIFQGLETRYAKEMAVVRAQFPSEPLTFTEEPLIIHWHDGVKMLRDANVEVDEFEDLSTPVEIRLGELVKQKYAADFFILDQYPSSVRPFYTMPNPKNKLFSNSYDIFMRGQEICSGAQRCHEAAMLEEQIRYKGMDPELIRFYVESFRHAVNPHAGAGIGLDRVVFLYLGLDNVRKASMFPRDPGRLEP